MATRDGVKKRLHAKINSYIYILYSNIIYKRYVKDLFLFFFPFLLSYMTNTDIGDSDNVVCSCICFTNMLCFFFFFLSQCD